jgi:uncharacterized protein (DUF2336 family)
MKIPAAPISEEAYRAIVRESHTARTNDLRAALSDLANAHKYTRSYTDRLTLRIQILNSQVADLAAQIAEWANPTTPISSPHHEG